MDVILGFLIMLSGVFAFVMMIIVGNAGNWQAFYGYCLHFIFVFSILVASIYKKNDK
jgi:uncharacterized membrane protein